MVLPLLALVVWRLLQVEQRRSKVLPPFPAAWRVVLAEEVDFYRKLSAEDRARFEQRVSEFLQDVRITGVGTTVTDRDRMLVAASAVIPIFGFPEWRYRGLREVLLYPTSFNHRFETAGAGRTILGQVGSGVMSGKMILSRPALEQGFANETSKTHVGIHEFVHLIDLLDGAVDGVPEVLLRRQYTLPWLELMRRKIEAIGKDRSDIDAYAGSSPGEFFPVVAEYFFKRPDLLARKHPRLYAQLERMFRQDLA